VPTGGEHVFRLYGLGPVASGRASDQRKPEYSLFPLASVSERWGAWLSPASTVDRARASILEPLEADERRFAVVRCHCSRLGWRWRGCHSSSVLRGAETGCLRFRYRPAGIQAGSAVADGCRACERWSAYTFACRLDLQDRCRICGHTSWPNCRDWPLLAWMLYSGLFSATWASLIEAEREEAKAMFPCNRPASCPWVRVIWASTLLGCCWMAYLPKNGS